MPPREATKLTAAHRPRWLADKAALTSRQARPGDCTGCGAPILAGLDGDWCAWPVVLDAEPVDYLHAVAAYLAGGAVYVLLHGEIHRLVLGQFQLPSCHRSRLPFHLAHTCPGGTR